MRVPLAAPVSTRTPSTLESELQWRFCSGVRGSDGIRTAGSPLPSSLVALYQSSGVVTWHGTGESKYTVCVEARRYIDAVLGTYVYAQHDLMLEELPASLPAPAITSPPTMMAPLVFGYVGYRFSYPVAAELASPPAGATDLSIAVGFKSRAEDGATNTTGMSFVATSTSAGAVAGELLVPVVGVWNTGWFALCFYAYYQAPSGGAMRTVASAVTCVDVVFAVDAQPRLTLSADPMFADPLNRPNHYSVAEGQELRVRIAAFKPPTDDTVTIALASGPDGAELDVESVGNDAVSFLSFRPSRSLAGAALQACVTARGASGVYRTVEDAQVCVTIEVRRCVWTVQEAESLVSLSQELGVSWLQLWNFNKANISRPDFDLQTGQTVNVGQLYAVDRGDTLFNLAERFSTSIEMIERMNADVADSKTLVADADPPQLLCITFNSCTGATVQ